MNKRHALYIWLSILMITATACGRAATSAPTAMPTPVAISATLTPTAQPAPTAQPTATAATRWISYHNDEYGFSFEYPAVYEDADNKEACGIKENGGGLHLGMRIEIQVADPAGQNLQDFTNSLLQSQKWRVDTQNKVTIGGQEAISLQYRFGGTNRFGTLNLLQHADRIVEIGFTAGSFCDVSDGAVQITEGSVYDHLIETFHFAP